MAIKTQRRRGAPVVPVTSQGWDGMFTMASEQQANPRLAHYLVNCRPKMDGNIGSRVGVANMGTVLNPPAAGEQVICFFSFTKAAGTQVQGRLCYKWAGTTAHIDTWDGTAWTTVVTNAQLVVAGISWTTVYVELFWCEFNNQVVFSDGVNVPWTWDGTAGAGIVRLTNAPIAWGPPTVYYGKLFFIKVSERDTIVWSEENQPNTGYEAGGYNNAWSLTQTGGGALVALLGTNAALVYFRADSIGRILGPVTTAFQSSGVHDDVSTSVGCGDYRSVVESGTDVWFISPAAHLYYIPLGSHPIDVTPIEDRLQQAEKGEPFGFDVTPWARRTFVAYALVGQQTPQLAQAAAFTQPGTTGPGSSTAQVWFFLTTPTNGTTSSNVVLVFDAASHRCQGYNLLPAGVGRLAVFLTPDGQDYLAYASNACFSWPSLPAVGADSYYTGAAFALQAIPCTFIDAPKDVSVDLETAFTQVDLVAYLDSARATDTLAFALRYLSSEYPTATLTPAAQSQSVAVGTGTYKESHLSYGTRTIARWWRTVVQWSIGYTSGTQPNSAGIKMVKVTAQPLAQGSGIG